MSNSYIDFVNVTMNYVRFDNSAKNYTLLFIHKNHNNNNNNNNKSS